jgi:acyl-coenzyme A thioesterase 13
MSVQSSSPSDHPFQQLIGPLTSRLSDDGRVGVELQIERRHLNNFGTAHGALLLGFADVCLFEISREARNGDACVTVSLTAEFLGPALEGTLLKGYGEVLRSGRSLLVVRGVAVVDTKPVLSFTGTLKRSAPAAP